MNCPALSTAVLMIAASSGLAQSTAFTYQGLLQQNGVPYSGSAELQPTLWNAVSNGTQIATHSPATLTVGVTNGLLTTALDFGSTPLNGQPLWLQLAVRTTAGAFTTLMPRHPISSAPYAVRALTAANLSGTLSASQLPVSVVTNGASNLNLSGVFNGNASGLTNMSFNSLIATTTNSFATGWGNNNYGQATVPAGLNNVVAVAVGGLHSLVLKNDGRVVAWGQNGAGQTSVPVGLDSVTAIAAGYSSSLALKSDGTVVAWGNSTGPSFPMGTKVAAIAAGDGHNLALKTDGTVVAWELNNYGQTNVPAGLNNAAAIAAGGIHSLALRSNGTVVAWGDNRFNQTNVPVGLANVVAIAAGYLHSLALKSDGTVVAWGDNSSGQTNVPVGLNSVAALAAGAIHSLALKSNGTVVAWGGNFDGESNIPLGLTNVIALAPGPGASHVLVVRRVAHAPAWLDGDNIFNGNMQLNGFVVGKLGINVAPRQVLHLDVPSGLGEGMQIDSATPGHAPAIYLNHTGPAGRNFRLASYGDNSNPGSFIIRDDTTGADRFTIDANGVLGGNGAGLTGVSVSAGSVSSGTLDDARLSSNVDLLNSIQTFTASKTFAPPAALSFGSGTRQMIDLWGGVYGIGVQASSLYFRCNNGSANDGFIWYKGGVHNDAYANPGGGTELMHLVQGGLYVNGALVSSSDRNAKENFQPVDAQAVLEKVAALPLSRWNYKQDPSQQHLGPMAQDFHAAFGVGPDDKHIATVDADGVALAAIQGLNEKVEGLQTELKRRDAENAELKARLQRLELLIERASAAR